MDYFEKIFNLKGKIAIVTGGLGLLGQEFVKTLIHAQAKVAVFDFKTPSADHPLIGLAQNQPLLFFQVDVTSGQSVRLALEEVIKTWGSPAVLINSAAIDFPPDKTQEESFEDYSLEKWQAVLNTNLTGVFLCSQIIGAKMAAAGGSGSIINISSIYGLVSPDQRLYQGFVKPAAYSVTKSGILNFTRYLATYWAKKNVRVNTLTPGGAFNNQNHEFVEKYNNRTPLGRMARPDEFNGAILFLASDASSYMTGANLIIDGGWTAW